MSRSDVTPGLQHADKLRRADPHRQLTIGVSLALRNEAQLVAIIAQVSNRKSPSYGHYLTPDQFASTYGPAQTQVQQVVDHLRASGLTVGSISSNRTIVDATGPVSAVEAAFGVTISDWHDRDQNRDFFGNDTEPTLPAAVASYVVGVAGLNNHYPLHRLGPPPRVAGTGPAGGYTPTELKKAYDITPLASAGYNGTGQRLGLFELDGFKQSNITAYDTQYGLGSPAPSTVLVSGGPNPPLGMGEVEDELDIELMHAIAPASPITVWEGPNTDPGVNATYNAMVTSNTTKSNSTSWGICEPGTTQAEMTTLDNIFRQAAAQGQSFFAASGDSGAYDCEPYLPGRGLAVDSPASDPYITATGGTNLTLNTDGTYNTESAWYDSARATGSGGGLSTYFARPSWQTGPGVANTYSNGKRQVPDVASDADPQTGYSVYVTYKGGTGWSVFGGTSAAAPAWAAFTGLYNQYAAAYSKPNLGYANPALYSTGSFAQAYPPFHDITTGDNLFYQSTANWDYPTGWGSFDAYNLARDLAGTLALTSVQASNVNSTSAVITWQTDHPATSQVDFGTTTSYGGRVVDTTNATNHSLTLSGLTSNTTYHFKSTSTDTYGNSGSSSDGSFTTFINLLTNGGLEVGSAGWSLAPQASIDSNPGDAHSGNNSLQMAATGPWQATSQSISITGGKSYTFIGWGRALTGTGFFCLFSYDANGYQIASSYIPFASTGSWIAAATTYSAPPNAVFFRLALTSSSTGAFWFDDISLSPTDNLLVNGGFEASSVGWSLAPQNTVDSNPADAHSGNNSLQLVATAPWQVARQTVPVTPGQAYSLTGWARSSSTGGYVVLHGYDAPGNQVSAIYLAFPASGSWTALATTYTPGPGEVAVAILPTSSGAGTYWFDDFGLTPTSNLISNSGFESGSAGWTLAPQNTVDSNPADAHSGNNSLQLVATAPWQVARQTVPVTPGQAYSFTGWARSSSTGGYVVLHGYDAPGNQVSSIYLPFPAGGSWTALAKTYTPGPGEVAVAILPTGSGAGTYWFDDLGLSPTSNLIFNGGFESGSTGWTLAPQNTVDSNPADAHSGNNSLQLVATAPWQVARQTVPVTPGQAYSLTGWARSSSTGGYVVLHGYDAPGNQVSAIYLAFPASGSWTALATTYTPGPGEVAVAILPTSSGAGTYWFDDFGLSQKR